MNGRFLCDVDGPVADLMGVEDRSRGFTGWVYDRHGIEFDPRTELRMEPDRKPLLLEFLAQPDCYLRWVDPTPGALEGLEEVAMLGLDLRFVTSITEEPRQYPAKDAWLERHVGPDFLTYTVPSREKHFVDGEFMVDDRADTIMRFNDPFASSANSFRRGLFLFEQPWSYAYGEHTFDWKCNDDFDRAANRQVDERWPSLFRASRWDTIVKALVIYKEQFQGAVSHRKA